MDACHILLGRLLLYDRKVMHNGFLNKYSFSKAWKKITLVPLSESEIHKSGMNILICYGPSVNLFYRPNAKRLKLLKSKLGMLKRNQNDGDQATNVQSHICAIQESQDKSLRAQGLTQMIKDMVVA